MNKLFRALLILLALVLCAMPLVACDKPDEQSGESQAADNTPKVPGVPTDIPDDSFTDKEIARYPSPDKKYYVIFNQITAPVDDVVGVSLCYYATDGTLLDTVEFYYQNGGRNCIFSDFYEVQWVSDGSAIVIVNDSAKTSFTLKDKR